MSCTHEYAFDLATANLRYRQDRYFHALVDSMTSLLASGAMTETDLAAAVQLAGVLHRHPDRRTDTGAPARPRRGTT